MFKKNTAGNFTPQFNDRNSLRQALIDFGISSEAAQHLANLGRSGLHLLAIDDGSKTERIFSKIGGMPDLPEGMTWPIRPSLPPINMEAPKNFIGKLLGRFLYSKPSEDEINYQQNPQLHCSDFV